MIELPIRDPCDFCEAIADREEKWGVIDEGDHTITVNNPWQFEIGQCCVITRRHVATLLDLSDDECSAIIGSAKRVVRRERAQVPARELLETAKLIRSNLPSSGLDLSEAR